MLKKLWKKRLSNHLTTLIQKLRYIFNDHFSLVIVFLLGMSSYAYAHWLKQLDVQSYKTWLIIGIAMFLTLVLAIGQLATLLQDADRFYLHHLGNKWQLYMLQSFLYSLILPILLLSSVFVVLYPLFIKLNVPFPIGLLVVLVLLKVSILLNEWYCLYQETLKKIKYLVFLICFISVMLYFWSMVFAISVALILLLVCLYGIRKPKSFDWDYMLQSELNRSYRNKQLLKLFVDVEDNSNVVKKSKILEKIIIKTTEPIFYLYQRLFVRVPYYKELVFKLSLVFIVLALIINEWWLLVVMAYLCQFLLGIQLVSAYNTFEGNSLYDLLPISQDTKKKEVNKIIGKTITLQLIVIVLTVIIKFQLFEIIISVGLVVIGKVILTLYIRQKIDKIGG